MEVCEPTRGALCYRIVIKLQCLSPGLAASLGYGAASELLRRSTTSSNEQAPASLMLTEGNIKRLVSKLTQMRGAALKLGQFMSIQGLSPGYMRALYGH